MKLVRKRVDEPETLVEFYYGTPDVVPVSELAESFLAIDRIYAVLGNGVERLAISELRTGSIIAAVTPFLPMMSQVLPAVSDAVTLSDFALRMKKSIDAFVGLEPKAGVVPNDPIASEIAAVMRPLAGKTEAKFGIARIRYSSKSAEREVEVVAEYSADEINRAVVNGERYIGALAVEPVAVTPLDERSFVKGVAMVLHQANRGPAKARGATGDRGIIEAISNKPLPVYFAEGVNRLKDRMIRSSKNPLRYVYVVDVWVHREGGAVKAYTVTEVHSASTRRPSGRLPKI